jgi:hypothetical protein
VGVEDAQHAGNRAVVDHLVGLVAAEGLRVVFFNQAVDAGEGLEVVTEGGLIGAGLRADFLADEHAGQTTGGKEDDQ